MKRVLILTLALAACSTPQTVVKERIVRVNVPVTVGCVTGEIEATPPLKSRYTAEQWAELPPAQKAAAVSAQGIRRQNEADRVRATAAGCPRV